MLAVLFWVVVVVCPEEFGVVVKGLTIPRQTRYAHIGQIHHDLDRLDDLPHLNNLAHLDDLFIAHLDIDLSRLSGSYICRLRYCAWRAVSQIPPGNHVRKSCAIQIPRGKHDLHPADHINQGCICPETSRSLNGDLLWFDLVWSALIWSDLICPMCEFYCTWNMWDTFNSSKRGTAAALAGVTYTPSDFTRSASAGGGRRPYVGSG